MASELDCSRSLSVRRVLVTGATSGIGLGIAQAFAAEGAQVTATGATAAEVESACRSVAGIRFARLDVRDGDAVSTLVASLGDLDVVVNCAGIIRQLAGR